jgi:hypothetical protein
MAGAFVAQSCYGWHYTKAFKASLPAEYSLNTVLVKVKSPSVVEIV